MSNKKLCLIITDAFSFNVLCNGQLEQYKREGVLLDLICGGSAKEFDYLVNRNVGRVHYVPIKRKPSLFSDLYSLLVLIRKLLSIKPSVVVYSTPKAMLLGSIASFMVRVPKRIALVRGRAYENYTGLKRSVFLLFDKVTFLASTYTVSISFSLASAMIKDRIVDENKIKVLGKGSSNGVDVDRFTNDFNVSEVKNKLGIRQRYIFLALGRICADKGAHEALNSYLKFVEEYKADDTALLFVGRNEDDSILETINTYKRKGKNIYYLESTKRPEEVLAISDTLLFLSHREGFGNVAIEAASMSVPVIAYDVVGVKDSVEQSITGFKVDKHDINAVTQIMYDLYSNAAGCRDKIKKHARKHVEENYIQKKVWDLYLKEYLS